MTKPYNEDRVIKPVRREPMTESDVEQEIASLDARIDAEMSPAPPRTQRPDGLEFAGAHRRAAELIIDNPRINREGRAEAYLDADPDVSNLPESWPL